MKNVILSSPILIGNGQYKMYDIPKDAAIDFTKNAENFCGHETVRILGINPAEARKNCEGYENALVLVPNQRLEFGKEYTVDEIEEIGISYKLITKI